MVTTLRLPLTADPPRMQFEHTLLVTETGVEILTARLPTSPPLWWEANAAQEATAASASASDCMVIDVN